LPGEVKIGRSTGAVAPARVSHAAATDSKVSFSAGVVEVAAGESQDPAIDHADRALHQAKQNGRNRVEAG
jgi:PleD family two-component response regulator